MRRHSDLHGPKREAQLRVALIGAGSMGRNHARVLAQSRRVQVAVVIDPDLRRAAEVAETTGATSTSDIAAATRYDAAVVAAPTPLHEEIAIPLLAAQIPVLIEKPIAADLASTERVLAAAAHNDVPLMCGFVERFNSAVSTANDLLDGELVHVLGLRHSPATPSASSSVVWDLLIHDIDLTLRLFGSSTPAAVHSTAWPPGSDEPELSECLMRFESGGIATLSSSRMGQRKVRELLLHTATSLVEVDLLRQDVTVYRHVRHEQVVGNQLGYRSETVVDIPFVRHSGEPLALQLHRFVDLVKGRVDAAEERATLLGPHAVASSVIASLKPSGGAGADASEVGRAGGEPA